MNQEKIEGVIRGIFKGGGYIQQADGQLFIYYESNLSKTDLSILRKNTRVVALLFGNTIVQITLKEDRMHWSQAIFTHLIV